MPVLLARVHLDHVDMPALDDRPVVDAFVVEIERRVPPGLVLVIDRARQDARGGGLAHAADAGEHEGMRDAART